MSSKRPWQRRLLVVAIGTLLVFSAVIAVALLTPAHEGPVSDHFDGKLFSNIPAALTIDKSVFEILRWSLSRQPGPWSERRDAVYHIPPRKIGAGLRLTFVNHATVLIQTDGLNILTDPMWSQRASPLQWLGPTRFRDAGIRFEDLPPIDIVLISHNHYDHMDQASIKRLAEQHDPEFFVPPGNSRYLNDVNADRITELDWWNGKTINGVEVHAVPAQHWSRRSAFDTNRALWSGYVILSGAGPVYFAGDTGMGPHFAKIRTRYGAPRLALLPIGNYLPRWFMQRQHINPAEAVAAHVLMGAQESMAIHFGTFPLGDDGQDEPIDDLRRALRAMELETESFWVPGNGDSRIFEADHESIARLTAR